MVGSEEQLRKLEQKVSLSDISIAKQDEDLLRREREFRELSSKLELTSSQLEEFQRRSEAASEELRGLREKEVKWEVERRRIQDAFSDVESINCRLELQRKSLGGDQQRLHQAIADKDSDIKNLRAKCDTLTSGISRLEDKCSTLAATVDGLNGQLERSGRSEVDLQERLRELGRNLSTTSANSQGVQEQVAGLQRALAGAENEKKILEDRLEASRQQNADLKIHHEGYAEKLNTLQSELQRSESRANQLDLNLSTSKAHLEDVSVGSGDNYLREELSRLRRESTKATDKIRDLKKTIVHLEAEKSDLDRRLQKSPYQGHHHRDHVDSRAQIPLMGGLTSASGNNGGGGRSHLVNVGEHVVRIKILEQENERFLRKIRGLESQLSELERVHGDRIQELLGERRRERDKENARQKETLKQMEESLRAREKIYKERILGLEEQVMVLKDQLAKEMRRRQMFITGSHGISNEMSELRVNLDQSLMNVTSPSKLDASILDRESNRLLSTVDRFGGDYKGRLTPSRLITSSSFSPNNNQSTPIRASASIDGGLNRVGMARTYSSSKNSGSGGASSVKRVLSFNDEV